MAATRELRRRIRSVKSIKQITKAMELVSSSKMRRATQTVQGSRPYAERLWEVVGDLTAPGSEASHRLLGGPNTEAKTVLAVVISSTRGLAGSYDSNVIKQALLLQEEEAKHGRTVQFITMGKKIEAALAHRRLEIAQSYPLLPAHPTLEDIQPIARSATASFLEGKVQRVVLIYTHFRSMLTQEATSEQLIPLTKPAGNPEPRRLFTYEPSPQEVLDQILPRIIEAELYQGLLESTASEHSARRMAMKNATDNATDMIDDLTLTYNGVRQGAITQELAEISGGAAALT